MKKMNSKLQKAETKSLIVAISFFAAVLTINAQGAAFENNSMNAETMALSANTESTKTTATATTTRMSTFATYIAEEKEAGLELEDWMLNKNNFYLNYIIEEASETPLKIESWMTDTGFFGTMAHIEAEKEEIMHVEGWMLKGSLFDTPSGEKRIAESVSKVKPENKMKAVDAASSRIRLGRRAFILIDENDPKLEMRQWMLDYNHWASK